MTVTRSLPPADPEAPRIRHTVAGATRRAAAEAFVAEVFERLHGARITTFAPNLMLLEREQRILAAAGWRCAGEGRLFLETYLDRPVETEISRLAGHPVRRDRIVEVGHLAADQRGRSAQVIRALATHLDALGYEWVVFTATRELIRIFHRLELPPLAVAPADPRRLGPAARHWGRYYDSMPVVVAGRIRLAVASTPAPVSQRVRGNG